MISVAKTHDYLKCLWRILGVLAVQLELLVFILPRFDILKSAYRCHIVPSTLDPSFQSLALASWFSLSACGGCNSNLKSSTCNSSLHHPSPHLSSQPNRHSPCTSKPTEPLLHFRHSALSSHPYHLYTDEGHSCFFPVGPRQKTHSFWIGTSYSRFA